MLTEEDLKNICINVSRGLVLLPTENELINNYPNLQSKLIFPKKEKKSKIRISEQESRVLFCHAIENYYKEIFYSIETPTLENYCFKKEIAKNNNGQSALFDMSLYELKNELITQKINIEFKAHNVKDSHIEKDILKLFKEPQSCLFFHTLKAINSGTLINGKTGIFDKYKTGILGNINRWNSQKEKYILFAICIIDQNVLLMKTFKASDFTNISDFFEIKFKNITRKKINFTNINNWIIKEDLK